MAKKKVDEDDFFKELAESTGGDILDSLDSVKYFIDCGNLALNYVNSGKFIGGGIPGGRMTEIYGPSAASKSLIGTNILFGAQKLGYLAVVLDTENAINKSFVKSASHCDLKKVIVYRPRSLERAFTKIYKLIENVKKLKGGSKPIVIVFDSISVLPCERELREINLPEDATDADWKRIVKGKEQPGERAKVCSKELRKLNSLVENSEVSIIILNQIRSKIGVMYGNPETTAGGGNALPFYASCRFRPQMTQKIEKTITAKLKKPLGIVVRAQNVKNRAFKPFVKCDGIKLFFETGFDPISGLLSCLLIAERLEGKSGNYTVLPEWSGGEEVKFKASLEEDTVPLEILLKCPALIDAKDAAEIQEYLEPFKAAMQQKDVEFKEVAEEEEDEASSEIDDELNEN